MKTVLIVIVTYNGGRHIRKCLTSFDCKNQDVGCMVVDNASTDTTVDIIKEEFPEVKLVEASKNLGFGAANNIGIQYALEQGYDYVYLLNQDAWIAPEDIMKLIGIAERHPDYGIISPLQVYADKNKIDNNFSEKITKQMKDDYLIPGNKPKELYGIGNRSLQAAHWLIRCKSLNITGGFSPSFFLYGEDTNLCRRMYFHGIYIGIAPGVLAVHNREHRIDTISYQQSLTLARWIHFMSDPNRSGLRNTPALIINMIGAFIRYKLKFFPICVKFLKNLPKYHRNRKNSIKTTGPFL